MPNKNIKIPISPFGSYIVSGEMGKIGSNLKYWFAMEIMKKNIKINETIQKLTIFKWFILYTKGESNLIRLEKNLFNLKNDFFFFTFYFISFFLFPKLSSKVSLPLHLDLEGDRESLSVIFSFSEKGQMKTKHN